MSATSDFRDWLVGQAGVTITQDNSPDNLWFTVDHSVGVGHETFIKQAEDQNMWVLSKGYNDALKEYKTGEIASGAPTW